MACWLEERQKVETVLVPVLDQIENDLGQDYLLYASEIIGDRLEAIRHEVFDHNSDRSASQG